MSSRLSARPECFFLTRKKCSTIWVYRIVLHLVADLSVQGIEAQKDDSFYIRSAQCVYDRVGLPAAFIIFVCALESNI